MGWISIFVRLLLPPILTFVAARRRVSALYRRSTSPDDLVLRQSPSKITALDIISIVLQIISKYVPIPLIRATSLRPNSNGKSFVLPLLRIQGPVTITSRDLERFRRALAGATPLPTANNDLHLLFLPCLTGPILPLILSRQECPILPFGSVNTKNTFSILAPSLIQNPELLQKASDEGQLKFQASFGGNDRSGLRRKRGVEFCIDIDIYHGSEIIIKQKCWFLMFLQKNIQPVWDPANDTVGTGSGSLPSLDNSVFKSTLSMTPLHPRFWARCCKDYNPIHVSRLGARLFGMPSVIAHGNHVLALAIEKMRDTAMPGLTQHSDEERFKSQARDMLWKSNRPFEIEVSFVKPMVLPCKAEIGWSVDGQNLGFVVGKGEKVYTTVEFRYS